MRIYGYVKEIVEVWFKKNGQDVKITPNANTYTGVTTFQLPPLVTGSGELVGKDTTQSLTNKTITGTFTGPLAGNVTGNVSGNVTGNVTGDLTGNVTGNVSGSAASFTGNLVGDVTGPQGTTVVATVGARTAAAVSTSVGDTIAATSTNTNSTIVKRDGAGNVSVSAISNTLSNFLEGAAPATPAAGTVSVYAKTDKKIYRKDSTGLESVVGGGLAPETRSTGFTAASGKNYLINTSGGAFTANLPAGSTEASIRFTDLEETWDTFNFTIQPAVGQKIDALAIDEPLVCDVKRGWVELNWDSVGSKWAFAALASTQVAVASATQAGIVSTGVQTLAGAKTLTGNATLDGAINLVKGRVDGAVVPAGYVGQVIKCDANGAGKTLSIGSYTDFAIDTGGGVAGGVVLSPGVWSISFNCSFDGANAAAGYYVAGIGTAPGTSGTGLVGGTTSLFALGNVTPVSGAITALTISNYVVNIPTTTSFYGKVFQQTGTANTSRGLLIAIRIA